MKINIIIITCPQLAPHRLSRQITQIHSAIKAGLVSSIEIICMDDSELNLLVTTKYISEGWNSDIAAGWDFFKYNIIAQAQSSESNIKDYLESMSSITCFPKRLLTQSEHSVALRHIYAIESVARSNTPCIILEDDALVRDEVLFHDLLQGLSSYTKHRLFFDLSDSYIPIGKTDYKTIKIGKLSYSTKPIAVTRTLMAYALFPEVARLLTNSLTCYSLPIDMQLQVLLSRLCIPGVSIINSPFRHGSKTNALPSFVRQS